MQYMKRIKKIKARHNNSFHNYCSEGPKALNTVSPWHDP